MSENENFYKNFNLNDINKKKLLNDIDLAIGLAKYNDNFGRHSLAQDMKVLSLGDGEVAACLAENSRKNNWGKTKAAQNLEVLKLKNGEVVLWLSRHLDVNKWDGFKVSKNLDFFEFDTGGKVAYWLIFKYSLNDRFNVIENKINEVHSENTFNKLKITINKLLDKPFKKDGWEDWGKFIQKESINNLFKRINFVRSVLGGEKGWKELNEYKEILFRVENKIKEAKKLGGLEGIGKIERILVAELENLEKAKKLLIGRKEVEEKGQVILNQLVQTIKISVNSCVYSVNNFVEKEVNNEKKSSFKSEENKIKLIKKNKIEKKTEIKTKIKKSRGKEKSNNQDYGLKIEM